MKSNKPSLTPAKVWGHLKLITTHKAKVAKLCFRTGIYLQGIVHDLSKYSPAEFIDSARYFNGERSPIEVQKETTGFSTAWLHHKGRNKHHHEYWVDYIDQGGIPCKMPFKYALELVCDSVAAGQVYLGKDWNKGCPKVYWETRKSDAKVHEDTYKFLTFAFNQIAIDGLDVLNTLKNYKYD